MAEPDGPARQTDEEPGELERQLRHDLNPLFTKPPDPGPMPETLRFPADRPAPRERSETSRDLAGVGAGWGLATDFLVTILAGLALGWALDHYAKITPWGILAGLALGLTAGLVRIVRQTQRAERAEAQRRARQRGG